MWRMRKRKTGLTLDLRLRTWVIIILTLDREEISMLTDSVGKEPGESRILFGICNILAGHLTTKGDCELAEISNNACLENADLFQCSWCIRK